MSIQNSRQHTGKSRQYIVNSIQGGEAGPYLLPTVYCLLSTKKSFLSTVYRLLSTEKGLLSTKAGFSLIELMITMVVFLLVIASASGVFTSLLTQFKQQGKVTETNIEGAIGLEILRRDLESAGYGLPWNVELGGGGGNDWNLLVGYCEAVPDATITPDPTTFNNGAALGVCPAAPTAGTAPMAVRSGNNTGWNGADYLSIKSTTVATNDTAEMDLPESRRQQKYMDSCL